MKCWPVSVRFWAAARPPFLTRSGERTRGKRAKRIAAATAALCVVGAIVGAMIHRSYRRQWARYEAVAQARSLAEQGQYPAAFRLAEEAARLTPEAPAIEALWPDVARKLSVDSEP